MSATEGDSRARTGVGYAAGAYVLWGIVPVFWKWLDGVSAIEIVAHRIVWTLIFLLTVIAWWQREALLKAALLPSRSLWALCLSAVLIAINWGIFIWAVTADRIVDTSLGYYITPFVNFMLGVIVLGERLTLLQRIAIGLALLGVANQTFAVGHLPWISLALAASFGIYGLIRKTVNVDSLEGLTVESIVLMPIALPMAAYLTLNHEGAFLHESFSTDVLLLMAGPITAIPLLMFAAGVRRIKLSTLGFLQFFAPTISLALAVLVYHEPFTATHGVTFAFIWSALALVTYEALRRERYSAA